MARFDWRSETIEADHAEVLGRLVAAADLADIAPARPKNGYENGAAIFRGDRRLCEVLWGGNPGGVHVIASGEDAPWLVEALRGSGWVRRVTRTDACEDWVCAGLFDTMSAVLLSFADRAGVKINQQGNWHQGESRTLYLGARSSVAQLVLYEKGHQLGGDPNWVRLEARAYPKRIDARESATHWEPGQVFQATRWMVDALACIGWDHLQPFSIGTVWRPSDSERARAALCRQYGAVMQAWAEEVGGWESLGPVIEAAMVETTH